MMNRTRNYAGSLCLLGALALPAHAEGDAAAEMARKLQDPLASITAIMTDNDVSFRTGADGKESTSYGFQIQPVKAFSFEEQGFNFIARGIIPILGAASESQRPIFGDPIESSSGRTWGLSDIQTQFFFSPKSDSAWKWGAGPMISWKTRTDPMLAGPGWGAGAAAVLVGSLSESVSISLIGTQLWGDENGFSTSTIQPMIYYNAGNGVAIGYNSSISYNWKADSGNNWTVPLGLVVGKTFDMGSGHGLDLSIGPYWNVVRPDNSADFVVKFGASWLFP
jgi:hypothetical protein